MPDAWKRNVSQPCHTQPEWCLQQEYDPGSPLSVWAARHGNLISLKLALCNITDSLTTAWGASFDHLTILTLSGNQLTGALPGGRAISSGAHKLTDLELDGNLNGQLPPSWGTVGSFSQLQRLNLASNRFTGTLPAAGGAPGSLPDLQILPLNNNNFTGQLPNSWAGPNALVQLETMYLQDNSLTGNIPLSWTNDKSKKYLRPGNQGMCEPIRARLVAVRTFDTTSPALSCLDAGCRAGDITSALVLGDTRALAQDCKVTIAADRTITSAGCSSGALPGKHVSKTCAACIHLIMLVPKLLSLSWV